jgi:UPF0716 family protein affecting phage T7 exclusion
MELKSQIGIAIALVIIAIALVSVVGFVLVRKNGFDGIRSMLGESELDKLISRINKYLKGE